MSAVQFWLIFIGVLITIGDHGIGSIFTLSRQSPTQIQAMWGGFQSACKPSPPDYSTSISRRDPLYGTGVKL